MPRKTASQVKTHNNPQYIGAEGRVMYPRALNSAPFNLYGLPPDQVHQFHAESFYWAPDSKSVIFADEVQAQLSVVWVRIGPRDQLTAYIHPVSSASEVCKSAKAPRLTGILTL